ncbi:MAG: GIY-YIG nuclease family protein [Candidatus Lokiarchaeota archaeon]|nr:GIY-YIG nuclease family protein [Candidatus Lokiarchaeota archaeon]
MKGCYLLLIKNYHERHLKIGKLGTILFKRGNYVYIGSAMGLHSTSLKHRLLRHIGSTYKKIQKKAHWHIDYFLIAPQVRLIKILILPDLNNRMECILSNLISTYASDCIVGFGSSDCNCKSHLYYFEFDDPIPLFHSYQRLINSKSEKPKIQ